MEIPYFIEQVRYWRNIISQHWCYKCEDNCCNSFKHRINIKTFDYPAINLFAENNVPVYAIKDIGEEQVKYWLINRFHCSIYTKKGKEILKPSLIEHPIPEEIGETIIWQSKTEFTLNVKNYCNFFDEEKKICKVHDDERRPVCCKEYPINMIKEEKILKIHFADTCPALHLSRLLDDVKRIQKNNPYLKKQVEFIF
ncbi:MAG: YkgJ family cysteine cluster protein [Nanoarchaeota archaeon]